MEEMAQLAANYGFPMVVAGYLLVRLEPVIKELQKSIVSLTIVVARQSGMEFEEISKIINGG
ncbi:MAG: YvrJ family protein [Peptococcaceae bacterium]|nr:YvrJ family protein [Peptococcaceae bacterium]